MLRSFDTPWKIWNELARWWAYPAVRLAFALNGVAWGRRWRLYGAPILQRHRQGRMSFGDGLQLRSTPHSNPLGPNRPVILCAWQAGAVLRVGVDFAMSGGTLCAAESIRIGDRVTVGANSVIVDTDFHPLDPGQRRREPPRTAAAPIVIEDDVFIGMGCFILKGVTLGRGCVVGAGSVVARDVPAGVVAAGNPAREVRAVASAPRG